MTIFNIIELEEVPRPIKLSTNEHYMVHILNIAPWEEFSDMKLNDVLGKIKVGQGKLIATERYHILWRKRSKRRLSGLSRLSSVSFFAL